MNGSQKIGALLGSGRSGSTWLGTILGAHPDVNYRFEPFTRHRTLGDPEITRFLDRALGVETPPINFDELASFLSEPRAFMVKPPFQPPGIVRSSLRWAAWTGARTANIDALVAPFEAKARPWMIFKDVDVVRTIPSLLSIDVPVLFLVRDPRAVVASRLKGQTEGHMPSARQAMLGEILSHRNPDLFKMFESTLPDLSPPAIEALLWRVDTDDALEKLAGDDRATVCFYDELIADPVAGAAQALEHFGLDLHPQVERFIEATVAGLSRRTRWEYGEIGIKPYFSVFRNPSESAHKWRTQLADSDIADIESVLDGSTAWTSGQARGHWS